MESPLLSVHAQKRCAQRGLRRDDIGYVLRYGTKVYRNGAVHYFLRRRDIPGPDRKTWDRLVGTTVVVAPDLGRVITVYRNRRRMPLAK